MTESLTEQTFKFFGPHGWSLHARHWRRADAKGTIVGLHGYSEHSGSYRHLAEFLWSRQWEVAWMDFPGHGLSDGKRSNIDRFEDYVLSVEAFVRELNKRNCPKPQNLFAHSLGGLVAIRYFESSSQSSAFSRLVLSSPLLGLAQYSPRFFPFLKGLTSLMPNITLPNEGELGGAVLTHDEAMTAKRKADPLIKSQVTFHWLREFIKARELAFNELKNIQIPVAIFQAGIEKVTSRSETERFYSLLQGEKFLKIYEGMFHELVNEVNRAQVMDDMEKWLSGQEV